MTAITSSPEEIVQQAERLYATQIQPSIDEQKNRGLFIAVDVDSSEYEIGDDYPAVAKALLQRCPNGNIAILRIGHAAVGRIGGRRAVS